MKKILLNPFSHALGKNPLMETSGKIVFTDGEYKIYRHFDRHFVHTFKNIVITERTGPNKDLINGLKNNIKPTGEASIYHDFERPQWAINEGLKIAKEINFTIQ
jgi:hypothetical protein